MKQSRKAAYQARKAAYQARTGKRDYSPLRYFSCSRSRRSFRRIFPDRVFGSSGTNSIARGYL